MGVDATVSTVPRKLAVDGEISRAVITPSIGVVNRMGASVAPET
jgi:hypothetical protein